MLLERDPITDPERVHDRDNDRTSELTATLPDRLEAERQAHAEARRLLAAALERILALETPREAPVEPSESPETPSEPVPNTEYTLGSEDARTAPGRAPPVLVATIRQEVRPAKWRLREW